MSALVLKGEHPRRGPLFAVVDPSAHHVTGKVAERKFGAWMSPFRSTEDAEAALIAAGGKLCR